MFSISVHGLSIYLLSQDENLEAIRDVRYHWPICKTDYLTVGVNKNAQEKIAELVAE